MLEKKGIHVQSTGTCAMNSAHLENADIIGAISSNNSSGMANARHSDISFPCIRNYLSVACEDIDLIPK